MVECLKLTQRTASTSRKAFWLFKSINHVSTAIELIETYSYAADEGLADFIDILEQLAVIVYYWYENLVFFCRTKMVGFTESDIDGWGNWSWFLEDFTGFLACIIRSVLTMRRIRDKQGSLTALTIAEDGKDLKSYEGNVYSMHRSVKNDLRRELALLRRKFWDNTLSLVIVSASRLHSFTNPRILLTPFSPFSPSSTSIVPAGDVRAGGFHGGCGSVQGSDGQRHRPQRHGSVRSGLLLSHPNRVRCQRCTGRTGHWSSHTAPQLEFLARPSPAQPFSAWEPIPAAWLRNYTFSEERKTHALSAYYFFKNTM